MSYSLNGKTNLWFFQSPRRSLAVLTRQSKRPLSVQIVHSRICNNFLSSLFIFDVLLVDIIDEKFDELNLYEQGGVTYIKIALDEMFTISRGCTPEFSRAKIKEEFWFHVRKENKGSRPSHIPFLPRPKNCQSHTTPPLPKSTPVILLLPFTWASSRFWRRRCTGC